MSLQKIRFANLLFIGLCWCCFLLDWIACDFVQHGQAEFLSIPARNISDFKNISHGLVHHWPLDGHGIDIVGGANAISEVNVGSTSNRYHAPNKAALFASGYYTLPAKTYIREYDFTITLWVKRTMSLLNHHLVEFGNTNRIDNIILGVGVNALPSVSLINNAQYQISTTNPWSLNVWYHLAYVFERNTIYLYFNGIVIAARANTPQARNSIKNSSFIGYDNFSKLPFIGALDDLRVYHRAISVPEINEIMNTTY